MLKLNYIAGYQDVSVVAEADSTIPFAESSLAFLDAFSKAILLNRKFRIFPELIAFAYWVRRSQLCRLEEDFAKKSDSGILLARGTVFHIAPSNVDTIFLYSMMLSLLVGNKNIVRISSRDSEQVDQALILLGELLDLPEHAEVKSRNSVITYTRSNEITAELSAICDLRVIWGGDISVSSIREIPIRPGAKELCFPDKVSLAVFDSANYNEESQEKNQQLANDFVKDTYAFGQMESTSPHMVFWLGDKQANDQASESFWHLVELAVTNSEDSIADVELMNKFVTEQLMAVERSVKIRQTNTNRLVVVMLDELGLVEERHRCGSGFFTEAKIGNLEVLRPVISSNTQTIVSYGIVEVQWLEFLRSVSPLGIDRIISPGQALDFFHVWDGYDLMREFVRETTISVKG